jgi:hypothetical protein
MQTLAQLVKQRGYFCQDLILHKLCKHEELDADAKKLGYHQSKSRVSDDTGEKDQKTSFSRML